MTTITAAIFSGIVVVALVGHGYFWMAIVNRAHGLAGPRKLVDGTTFACLFAFLTLPPLLVWNGPEVFAHWLTGWEEPVGFPTRYLQFCVAWCVGQFLLKAAVAKVKNDPQTLRLWCREPAGNGVQDNGVQDNGVEDNGVEDNGVEDNGAEDNGAEDNGAEDNGAEDSANMFHGAYSKLLARVPGNQILQLRVDHKRISIPRLHASHEGLTIAHLSDFHMTGHIDRAWFEMVVREVNRLEADVVAITGDIAENEACLPWLTETLCQLEAKLGIYFILGNHDKYVDFTRTRDILIDAGQTCLSGRWLQVEWNGAPVILAGNERPWFTALGALEEAPPRGADNLPLRLLLMHSPDQIAWACRHDADLVLAGHMHGGQVCFPILGPVACPSLHGTRYTDGVYREGATIMHVTRGLSGRTPLRWLCPPEIALLELVT